MIHTTYRPYHKLLQYLEEIFVHITNDTKIMRLLGSYQLPLAIRIILGWDRLSSVTWSLSYHSDRSPRNNYEILPPQSRGDDALQISTVNFGHRVLGT